MNPRVTMRLRQPVVTIAAALALALGSAGGAAAVALGAHRHGSSRGRRETISRLQRGWRSYRAVTGWRVRYPTSFHVETSAQELKLSIVETTIASFTPTPGIIVRTYPGGGNVRAVPPLDRTRRFPPGGVALRVLIDQGALTTPGIGHATAPRLSLADLRPSRTRPCLLYNATTGETLRPGLYHGAPRSLARSVNADGAEYTVVVWIGRHARARQRRELAGMLASLAFPMQRSSLKTTGSRTTT